MLSALAQKVNRTIGKYGMLRPGDKVLVALSGGPDSVCLVAVLAELAADWGIKINCAHLNHRLRGRASQLDEQFVKQRCRQLHIPVTVKRVDINAKAKREKKSLEAAGREARYTFLETVARQVKAQRIATGHTADDQAETVLMRLVRGTGRTGLAGIPATRDHTIIRPLLDTTKKEILRYLKSHRIPYRLDESNLKTDFSRNKIRHRLLPYLKKNYNPQIVKVLAQEAELAAGEEAYLDRYSRQYFIKSLKKTTKNKIILDKSRLLKYNIIFIRRILRSSLKYLLNDIKGISFAHIQNLLENLAGKVRKVLHLPGGIRVEISARDVIVQKARGISRRSIKLRITGTTQLWDTGEVITARLVRRRDLRQDIKKTPPDKALLDYGLIHGPLLVRTRRAGDRFTPLGLKGTKKLKDFFMEQQIPRLERDHIPLVETSRQIVWVAGWRLNDHYKITGQTKDVLELTYKNNG